MQPKYAFVIIAIFLIAATPAVSADLMGDIVSGITNIVSPTQTKAMNESQPIVIERAIDTTKIISIPEHGNSQRIKTVANYEYKRLENSFIQNLLGIQSSSSDVTVIINGTTVATIPPNSKLLDVVPHSECLQIFPYGSDQWYTCEVSLT